jgi:putative membrane protein
VTDLADGEWHRLHPATPLLKGGIAFIAIIGFIIVNLRDTLINTVLGGGPDEGDPFVWLNRKGLFFPAALIVLLVLALFVAGFYVSWRMHTFRITDEVVEVRSGIFFRTHRKGRLDRIQGINIVRPLFARFFGAARLEVDVAGHDANIHLAYLSSSAADELRREVLRMASGTRAQAAQSVLAPAGSFVEQRLAELLAPELDPSLAPRESVVTMHLGRLIGSLLLSNFTIFFIVVIVGTIVGVITTGQFLFLVPVLPAIIGMGSFYFTRFTKSLRYSIAGTPDGIRVGFGLLTTSNETLPPGRIHSVQLSQPLLWRPAGWWEIKVNRASTSSTKGAAGQANTTILPVGNKSDVLKVLALVLPALSDPESIELLERGLYSRGGDDGYVNSPRRAAILRWFSWRRNGFAITDSAVLLRKGVIWRRLILVPLARSQSVSVETGPLRKRLRLATVRLHTVAGPISAALGAIDIRQAWLFFATTADAATASAASDTSHRWRSNEVPA